MRAAKSKRCVMNEVLDCLVGSRVPSCLHSSVRVLFLVIDRTTN